MSDFVSRPDGAWSVELSGRFGDWELFVEVAYGQPALEAELHAHVEGAARQLKNFEAGPASPASAGAHGSYVPSAV